MTRLDEALREAAEAVGSLPGGEVTWYGVPIPWIPAAGWRALPAAARREYRIWSIQQLLYARLYCSGRPLPETVPDIAESPLPGVTEILHLLSRSDRRPGGQAETLSGIYLTGSEAAGTFEGTDRMVRLYWNVEAHGAAQLVGALSGALGRMGLRYRLKVNCAPLALPRCDAATLYLEQRDYPAARPALEVTHSIVEGQLASVTPAFTLPLARGLGLAEDPGRGGSFGQHRCRLVAEGLVLGEERGARTVPARVRSIEERLAASGISLSAPHLNPGSRARYPFAAPRARRHRYPGRGHGAGSVARSQATPAAMAEHVAGHLLRTVLWSGDRCTWLGLDVRRTLGGHGRVFGPVDATLYGGTAGIALFLAEAAAAGVPRTRPAAIGAARQSLISADRSGVGTSHGFHAGWPGVAFAAARVGLKLGDESLLRLARAFLRRRLAARPTEPGSCDFVSGLAGTTAGLVALEPIFPGMGCVEHARRWGDRILRRKTRSRAGWSWNSRSLPARRNLSGFAHGAAGIGTALLELHLATRERRFRDGALRALSYEEACFDPGAQDWPDYRARPDGSGSRAGGTGFVRGWCSGAPGIALARLRLLETSDGRRDRPGALRALEITGLILERALEEGRVRTCLCHGLAGWTDVLLEGIRVLGEDWTEGRRALRLATDRLLRLYAGDPALEPVPLGATPALMTGLAGIGLLGLRIEDPSIPSPLLPRTAIDCCDRCAGSARRGRRGS